MPEHPPPEGPAPGTQRLPPPLPWHWQVLESWFARVYRTEVMGCEPNALFSYNLIPYQGPRVALSCGTLINSGDKIMDIHFRREGLAPLAMQGEQTGLAIGLLLLADRAVPLLALELERDPRFADVKALHALTLFHRGIRRYGFEVFPVRERHLELWFTWWQKLLLRRDHPLGAQAFAGRGEGHVVRHVWVSRAELIRRYGRRGTRR